MLRVASLRSQKCDVKGMVLRIHETALLCHDFNVYLLYIIRALKGFSLRKVVNIFLTDFDIICCLIFCASE